MPQDEMTGRLGSNSTEVSVWGIQYDIYYVPHAVIWLRDHQQNMQ